MRLIRGRLSTAVFAKIADEARYRGLRARRPQTRSVLQFGAGAGTESKGFRRLFLRRKVAS